MTISVSKELPSSIVLRRLDEAECRAAGMSGDEAVRQSVALSDWHEAVYINERLAAVWGYGAQSLFSYRCQAWLLTTDLIDKNKIRFTRSSIRVMKFLFERFEEVEIIVHDDHYMAVTWLQWIGFAPIASSKSFTAMLAKRSESRWVS